MSTIFAMYHCTTPKRAAAIMAEGFKVVPGSRSIGGVEGIWMSDAPIGPADGWNSGNGDTCIELTFDGTIDRLADYAIVEAEALDPLTGEWVETGITQGWEWIVPADVANTARRRIMTEDEADEVRYAIRHPSAEPKESRS